MLQLIIDGLKDERLQLLVEVTVVVEETSGHGEVLLRRCRDHVKSHPLVWRNQGFVVLESWTTALFSHLPHFGRCSVV